MFCNLLFAIEGDCRADDSEELAEQNRIVLISNLNADREQIKPAPGALEDGSPGESAEEKRARLAEKYEVGLQTYYDYKSNELKQQVSELKTHSERVEKLLVKLRADARDDHDEVNELGSIGKQITAKEQEVEILSSLDIAKNRLFFEHCMAQIQENAVRINLESLEAMLEKRKETIENSMEAGSSAKGKNGNTKKKKALAQQETATALDSSTMSNTISTLEIGYVHPGVLGFGPEMWSVVNSLSLADVVSQLQILKHRKEQDGQHGVDEEKGNGEENEEKDNASPMKSAEEIETDFYRSANKNRAVYVENIVLPNCALDQITVCQVNQ